MSIVPRRDFLFVSSVPLLAASAGVVAAAAPSMRRRPEGDGLPKFFPATSRDDVRRVVGRSHTDYEAVHEMVTARPSLARAAWDWGFGDWESALGAASHMGRRDIAGVLIAHGARPDLFTFAMLGQVDVVRAVCEASPGIQKIHGPHGITLLQHARHGGTEAESVVNYLEELGGADDGQPDLPIDEQGAASYVGDYVPVGTDDTDDTVFHVTYHERRSKLTLARDDEQFRFLLRESGDTFNPGGAASVRVIFDVRDGKAVALAIHDGPVVVEARRGS